MLDPGGAPWRRRFDGWTGSRRPSLRSPRSSRGSRSGTRTRRSRTSRWATRRRCRCRATSTPSGRRSTPHDKDWFAYKMSEPNAQAAVARSLTARTGLDWDPADVAMTNGGFAAIAVTLRAIVEPGDEVVFLSPPWFFYELLIVAADGVPVRVRLDPPAFDLDVAAIDGRDHPADPGGPHQHAAQPDRADLPDRAAPGTRRPARPAIRRSRPPDPADQRRAVQPDRVRRRNVPQPGRGLPEHDHRPTRTARRCSRPACGSATSRSRRRCPTARRSGRPSSSPRSRAATRSRTLAPARDRGPRAAVDRHRGARAPA